MKKIFSLILILFICTACSNKINEENDKFSEILKVVKDDRGLDEWTLFKKTKNENEYNYFYKDRYKNINSISIKIDNDSYLVHIHYNLENFDYQLEHYNYEDYDYYRYEKIDGKWKSYWIGE